MTLFTIGLLLALAVTSGVDCVRNTPRSLRASRNEGSLEFECPEEFGYYPHPRDCTQYYVCVFGGALLESCTGGLMYSHELQTCDWPRNVGCLSGGSIAKETEEEDVLLERSAKAESAELHHQQQQQQQQHHQSRHHQRQPIQRQQSQVTVTSSSPPVSQITERQQPRQRQQHQRTYEEVDEYEPASEIESDRQQRVYRGQPSTVGQVQRDRDGLRRNIISERSESDGPREGGTLTNNVSSNSAGTTATTTILHRGIQDDSAARIKASQRHEFAGQTSPTFPSTFYQQSIGSGEAHRPKDSESLVTTSSSRSILQQPRSRSEETSFTSPTSIASQWQRSTEEFERNEISVTPSSFRQRPTGSSEPPLRPDEFSAGTSRNSNQPRSRTDVYQSSSPSWLRSTEELEKNEISVSPGPAGRGFMVKRLRADRQDFDFDEKDVSGVTPAYSSSSSEDAVIQHERGESRNLEVSVSPSRQRTRENLIPSGFQPRATEKSSSITDNRLSTFDSLSARRASYEDPENRKYYAVTIPQRYSTESPEDAGRGNYLKTRKVPVNPVPLNSTEGDQQERKYYIPLVQQQQQQQQQPRQRGNSFGSEAPRSSGQVSKRRNESMEDKRILEKPEALDAYSPSSKEQGIPEDKEPEKLSSATASVKATTTMVATTTTTSISTSDASPEDPTRNEVGSGQRASGQRSELFSTSAGVDTNETEGNEIPSSNRGSINIRARQRSFVRGQSRHKTKEEIGRTARPEREKDSLVNSRGQTESHYRAISSESPRTAKTTVSTSAPISKSYYSDPDQSYPYYTIYDDDVIYKDDDYAQYTVNRTVQIQQQPQLHHHQHQQQNVRIAEVTPNSNQYSQKPKKVTINDADKYNLNPEVTVSDYDIYDNQPLKNKFRISDGQQSLRTNGLSHSGVHVTTPNAIIDTYVPLTTTTQPPPTTTIRPYTVTVQNRGRPQVNRGTAPPRLRPTLKPSTAIVAKAQEYVDIYRYPPVRPGPIYPTPTVDKPAAKCRKDVCLLPDCNCGGTDIPGGIPVEKTPQIVLLTFDDAVNDLNKQLYEDLFERGRKNPNGCPISSTLYVSHEWTDYSQVQNLYADGHELASHTVSHSFGEQFSARKWAREVAGQREILAAYGGVKLEDVRGMRAPFLSVGGNNMFKMLWDTNFTYDSSMPIYENRPPSWPYTLDYKLFHDCMIPPCPTRSYPGLWEVPMVMWQDLNGGRCSMGDACSNPPTSDGVYKMLIKNFERHYTTNRAPFGLFYHAAWFTQPHHKEGFISFLDTIVAMDDVWVVTNWQALQWVRNPTPIELLDRFEPFGCNYPDRPKKCNNPKVCNLWHKSGVRYMKTCQPCPDIYPWTGKTGIRSSRIDNEIEN
ncbi:uncharacterized protein Cda5 isoform X2 [Venturia canescens]|uniref:uncharacterized protein Cda5 isoform X2 n=1 Tax=Venturia canescens TaxID=32260 RepID=UPI001C9CB029|nr:uncharacterized protein LOC122409221 isoform X2 [Venturia canescens]XP_043272513.1 uncharacterized protein LOC122409221 isoform X2 [Venturia canescens]